MAAKTPDPQPEMDVDFGDTPATPAETRTPPPSFSSRVHPADEEWEQPETNLVELPVASPPRKVNGSNPYAVGRVLPASLEAEEYLLSCCLLDGADVIERALEAKIRPESFYDSKHGIVFAQLVKLFTEKKLTDVSVVAEELKSQKLLDTVGGYAFLTQVSSRIPTTAQAGYFIDKVREQSLLREIIRAGKAAVEDAYNFSGGIEEFLEEQQERMRRVIDGSSVSSAEQIAARAFDIKRQIKKPDPIFTLAGTTISTPGNLTAIYSQAKTGKSSTIGAAMAAAMTTPTSGHDTLGIVGPNYGKLALLHFDTEQSPYDWQQLVTSALRRVDKKEPPSWLMSYTLTGMSAPDARNFIKATIKRAVRAHGGIHCIIIDGIADLVVDPNDPAECFPLVTELHATAIEHNTAVICILHMNPGSEVKGRGHLGSQLERKCESNLTLEKEGEVTRIWGIRQRGKVIEKDKAPCFKWSDEHQMHRTCATPGTPEAKSRKGANEKYTFSEFKNAFPEKKETPKPLSEIHRIAAASVPINLTTFYNVVHRFVREGMIDEIDVKGQKKTYRLSV
jgi:hypothetical protein